MDTVVLEKSNLMQLYDGGMSMFDIAKKLDCSVHKVVYWMNKYSIERRSRSDAIYAKLNPDGDPFKIKEVLTSDDLFLKGLGFGIYWGEGNKASPHVVGVANTDPKMLISFITFLKEICSVTPKKICYSIVCFNDSDVDSVALFWSHKLQVPIKKFGKIVKIRQQGKGTYRHKSKYGVCTVSVCNVKLKKWLMGEIRLLDARVV